MIVVRTLSTVGGIRTRYSQRRADRKARTRGYRNAQAWALAVIERQLKLQSAEAARDVDYGDAELRVAALEAA
ncbi:MULTISPECIES: hypothetical protein [Burkholderia]|uniref:hypothetical protein n=1 Tax=Burkholderia TaxID=32008 RepID=UPI000751D418|nr:MULTISPECIES: hypothetical protein [Burkholderia]AOJ69195.1 hypothetical protein WS78_10830 [Burkholderia savannae]KVG39834.1 hypothetical protein WS77_19380 [Burkholderia sp. MSMB0265]KVG85754.1 hypothetical protein WS81_31295 [Burkholderia sp. MSMB2040]KVG92230.1 hypothetical protein WS82_12355 [Burkholderia sp. MSMB2041]KVG95691.1 hypothetical protein WS83_03880 [Burkholderia sp. MSMB2042]